MIPPITPISAIASANPAASTVKTASPSTPTGGFANLLGNAIDQLNQTTTHAQTLAMQAATGQANVADVTVASTEATLAIELVTQVRDRAITAFNSIMNMPA